MAPFYGWGSTASRLEPLQGGSLLFTTKFPEKREKKSPKWQKILSVALHISGTIVIYGTHL